MMYYYMSLFHNPCIQSESSTSYLTCHIAESLETLNSYRLQVKLHMQIRKEHSRLLHPVPVMYLHDLQYLYTTLDLSKGKLVLFLLSIHCAP